MCRSSPDHVKSLVAAYAFQGCNLLPQHLRAGGFGQRAPAGSDPGGLDQVPSCAGALALPGGAQMGPRPGLPRQPAAGTFESWTLACCLRRNSSIWRRRWRQLCVHGVGKPCNSCGGGRCGGGGVGAGRGGTFWLTGDSPGRKPQCGNPDSVSGCDSV